MTEKERKRALRKKGRALMRERADAEWDKHMVIAPDQLAALLDYLDERLPEEGCDHTLRLTRGWAEANGVGADELETSVLHFGGGCDCEVLSNVDPETGIEGWSRYRGK